MDYKGDHYDYYEEPSRPQPRWLGGDYTQNSWILPVNVRATPMSTDQRPSYEETNRLYDGPNKPKPNVADMPQLQETETFGASFPEIAIECYR